MSTKAFMKREILKEIKETRKILNNMEEYTRTGNPLHMAMVATFFHVLGYHLEHGDLSPENIDLALHIKHQDFLQLKGE